MYTARSRSFSKEFEAKAKAAIVRQIESAVLYSDEMFGRIMLNDARAGHDVKQYGHRWKSVDDIYHGMIMRLERRIIEERGPGAMTDGEARNLEKMFMLPTTGYMFDIAAADGIRAAASADHWYMFEKQWD